MPPSFIQRSSERRRWLSEIEKPPRTDATPSMTPSAWSAERPRFSRISTQALREALAEGAGEPHQAAFSSRRRRRGRRGARPGARRARRSCGSCVTRMTVFPCRCSSWKSAEHLGARLRVEGAGRLVGEEERRAGSRAPARWRRAAAGRPRAAPGGRSPSPGSRPSRAARARAPRRSFRGEAGVEQRQLDVPERRSPSGGGCSSGRRSRPSRCGSARARRRRAPPPPRRRARSAPRSGSRGSRGSPSASTCPSPTARRAPRTRPRATVEVDPAQGVDGHAVRPEDLRQAARLDDRRHGQLSSSFSTFFRVGSSRQTCSSPFEAREDLDPLERRDAGLHRDGVEVVLPVLREPDELAAAREPLLRLRRSAGGFRFAFRR